MCLSVSFSRLAWAYSQACLEKLQEREWELQGNLRPRLRTGKNLLLQHSIGQSKYKVSPGSRSAEIDSASCIRRATKSHGIRVDTGKGIRGSFFLFLCN